MIEYENQLPKLKFPAPLTLRSNFGYIFSFSGVAYPVEDLKITGDKLDFSLGHKAFFRGVEYQKLGIEIVWTK